MVAWNKNLLLCGTLLRKRKAINIVLSTGVSKQETGPPPVAETGETEREKNVPPTD